MPIGGLAPIAAGGTAFIPVDLAAATYALLCFVPDAKDGQEHSKHGMIKDFTVGT